MQVFVIKHSVLGNYMGTVGNKKFWLDKPNGQYVGVVFFKREEAEKLISDWSEKTLSDNELTVDPVEWNV